MAYPSLHQLHASGTVGECDSLVLSTLVIQEESSYSLPVPWSSNLESSVCVPFTPSYVIKALDLCTMHPMTYEDL